MRFKKTVFGSLGAIIGGSTFFGIAISKVGERLGTFVLTLVLGRLNPELGGGLAHLVFVVPGLTLVGALFGGVLGVVIVTTFARAPKDEDT